MVDFILKEEHMALIDNSSVLYSMHDILLNGLVCSKPEQGWAIMTDIIDYCRSSFEPKVGEGAQFKHGIAL